MSTSSAEGPTYEDVENIQPFTEVAEERGYTIGEYADDMAVGVYEDEGVLLESQGSEEASYNIMADIMSDHLSEYDVRAPSAFYDSESTLEEVDAESPGVLITEELGEGSREESDNSDQQYAESLIDTFAFEALMGQGDIPENTEVDVEGFYMFDFANSGANIKGVYEAIKSQARSLASEISLDEHIEDYDVIGNRAAEMAQDIDLGRLSHDAETRDVLPEVYEEVKENIQVAGNKPDSADTKQYFSPESHEEDKGVELL